MNTTTFMSVFAPFQLIMTWLNMVIKELAHDDIKPVLSNIVGFDPWLILDWGESMICRLEISADEWDSDDIPNIFDSESNDIYKILSEYTESVDFLRYDLEEIYGEAAAQAIELVDQELIKFEEEWSTIFDEDPGW